MDAMTVVSPAETERRATTFAAEFLAPIDDIAFDLDRVSVRTVHELDELRMIWGVSVSSLVVRAREHVVLSDYQYRSMFRLLNETGRMYGPRPGVADEHSKLTSAAGTTHGSRLHDQRTRRNHPAHKHTTRRPVPDRRRSTQHSAPHHGLNIGRRPWGGTRPIVATPNGRLRSTRPNNHTPSNRTMLRAVTVITASYTAAAALSEEWSSKPEIGASTPNYAGRSTKSNTADTSAKSPPPTGHPTSPLAGNAPTNSA